eukprot:TRINITY_DN10373_c0_g1_i1.p2 TRINITY_DN10373_c0_g1~~TRINITY_DN10373_c0_g1_i1.p2  ORF type:complete len:105 (-),score=25.05 TRINITY_DN10373_c0_g1_i1:5-319(-)
MRFLSKEIFSQLQAPSQKLFGVEKEAPAGPSPPASPSPPFLSSPAYSSAPAALSSSSSPPLVKKRGFVSEEREAERTTQNFSILPDKKVKVNLPCLSPLTRTLR